MAARPKYATHKKSLEKRQHILEVAEVVFAKRGFAGTHMREIAREAGVNKTMLYYHFDNKAALYGQIAASYLRPIFARLEDILSRESSLEETVGEIYDMYAHLFARKGERLRPLLAREIAAGAPLIKNFLKDRTPQIFELWSSKFARAMGKSLSKQQIAMGMMSITTSVIATFLLRPIYEPIYEISGFTPQDESMKNHVVQVISSGLRSRFGA